MGGVALALWTVLAVSHRFLSRGGAEMGCCGVFYVGLRASARG